MRLNKQKRVLAVHDISCVGKCSLTVALPILSAAGLEVSVLPTAVLSTHTGGFTGYTFRDLTEDIIPICDHWDNLGITFDAIYTGYLGSLDQIELLKRLIERFGKDALVLVDPVMADNGKLYKGFDEKFPEKMAELCKTADVIIPNLTEASFLLDENHWEYIHAYRDRERVEHFLERLHSRFNNKIVLTSVSFDEERIGAACYDNGASFVMHEKIPGIYHGTGDIFGSSLLAGLMNGLSLYDSAQAAVNFTVDSIKMTDPDTEPRYGVRFESALKQFILRFP